MTFSIVARSADGREFGLALSSSSIAVAARCGYVQAQVGAVLSQNLTDPRLGPRALGLLNEGMEAQAAVELLLSDAPGAAYRQVAVVDKDGRVAHYSGSETLPIHAAATGVGVVAVGNLLGQKSVPAAMVKAFSDTPPHELLPERLMVALEAGLAEGGEAGPVHSAGLLTIAEEPWPWVDLRVDLSDEPIAQLRVLWGRWRPEAKDYVARALQPHRAPAFQ